MLTALEQALKDIKAGTVKEINMWRVQIGDGGAQMIADALKVNKSITKISLFFNGIEEAGAESIADCLKVNKSITEINLSNNNIGDGGAQSLADALRLNKSITWINLSHNQDIGEYTLEHIDSLLERNKDIAIRQRTLTAVFSCLSYATT